jgi:hypothetical protein
VKTVYEVFRPRTSYVVDRLRGTSWAERHVILDLIAIENLYLGDWGGGMRMLWPQLQLAQRYPLEAYIVRHELKAGLQISEAEAQKRMAQDAATQRAREVAHKARQAAEQEERDQLAYRRWIEAGGLP